MKNRDSLGGAQLVVPASYDEFQYVIVPGDLPLEAAGGALYDKSYAYYKETWERIMSKLTGPGSFHGESFFQQHCISNLFYRGEVIAQISSRFLDLERPVTFDLEYFENFRGRALAELRAKKARRLLTVEWNSVHAGFSKRKANFPFVEVMLRLCMKIARAAGADAGTGVPRRLTGVQDVLADIGFRTMESNLVKYRCPIDIMVGFTDEVTEAKDSRVTDFLDHIWTRRLDLSGRTNHGISGLHNEGLADNFGIGESL